MNDAVNRDNLRAVFRRHGPPGIMELIQEEPPDPGAGQIRVRVETAGVSPADLLICWGLHPESRRFVEVLRDKEPAGVDVVFDGLGHTVARSYRVLNRGGTVVAYGHAPVVAGGRRRWGKLLATMAQFAWIFGRAALSSRKARLYSIQELRKQHPDWYSEDLARLFRLLGDGAIKPRVFDRMPLERAQDALELISQSAADGKIILFAD